MIVNIEARNNVIAAIKRAPANKRFASDWTCARYLAPGERVVGIVGGFANSIIHKPYTNARGGERNMLFFYGPGGSLVHEEAYSAELDALAFGGDQ